MRNGKDMDLPRKITVFVHKGDEPVEGVLTALTFRTNFKNDYDLVFGPTNPHGQILVTEQEIVDAAEAELNFALMDYGHLRACFSGVIEVSLMDSKDLDQALNAYDTFFQGTTNNATGYEEKLKRSISVIEKLEVDKLRLQVVTEPQTGVRVLLK